MTVRYQIRLTRQAERDLASVLRWFAEQRAMAAGNKWVSALMAKLVTLERNPDRCPIIDESTDVGLEIREILFGKRQGIYRLLFRIDGRTVHLLRIWHAARETPTADDLFL